MSAFIWLVDSIFSIAWWMILISVVMSWLVQFNIINLQNPTVRQFARGLAQFTEPLLGPVRRFIPSIGGLDFSPVIVLLLLEFLRRLVIGQLASLV